MLWNYIKISIRNIRRHKLFSAINIISLTLSITICLAALMIIKNQLDLDKDSPYPDRTYRIITDLNYENESTTSFATSPLPMGQTMLEDYPFIKSAAQIHDHFDVWGQANGKKLDIRGNFANAAFFKIFGIDLLYGNPGTALSTQRSVVLTEHTANRYFENQNPVGSRFTVEGMGEFTVTGVLNDKHLEKSHLQLGGMLISLSTLPMLDRGGENPDLQWGNPRHSWTYILLEEENDQQTLKEILPSLSQRISATYNMPENVQSYTFHAQALDDIVPSPEQLRNPIGAGKIRASQELVMLGVIAFVILFMACFNYTNLSIARALKRAREIGVYKVLGALRSQIITQFIVQATIVAGLSLFLAYAVLPFIPLPSGFISEVQQVRPDLTLITWLILFSIFTGLLAGILPAWLLSSRSPAEILRNTKNLDLISGLTVRKTLVVAQFTLSIIMIVVATVGYQQSQYVATSDYGFKKENIVNLELQDADPNLLREQIANIAGVEHISAISDRFGFFSTGQVDVRKNRTDTPIPSNYYSVDRNLIPGMDLQLLAGSNFPEGTSDSPESHVVINETAVERLGWEHAPEAVGQNIWLDDSTQVEIAGVLEDFHYHTMSLPIRPMVLRHRPEEFRYLNIELASSNTEQFENELAGIWENTAPLLPLEYSRLDHALYEAHSHEQDVASISYYALIAIAIACLGLLGMVTYSVEVRTQEVGIRKVLGGSITHIITLLSKEFVWLLLLAAFIGLPVGYIIGQEFLNTYAYHIDLGPGPLLTGIVIMGGFGLLAIGTQIWQIARQNPVDAIRTE